MLIGGLMRRWGSGQDSGADQSSGDSPQSFDPGAAGGSTDQAPVQPGPGSDGSGPLPLFGDLGLTYQVPASADPGSSSSSGSTPSPVSGSGSGFIINVIYDSSVSSAPAAFITAIQAAVRYLESVITAPVTVNIDVGYGEIGGQSLGSGALGESEAYLNDYSYSSIQTALTNVDPSAAATLPASAPGTVWLATAEAKALGLASASSNIDGYAGFSSSYPFAYDPNNRAVSGEYDFIGVAEHEFTEDMGRIDLFNTTIGGVKHSYSLLDLFHYTSQGTHTYTGTTTNYFSADGGKTNLDNFNSDPNGDLGDWAASAGHDSFLAFSPTDEADLVSQSDITEMNALGYQIGSAASTPPGTSATMIMGDGQGNFDIYDLGNSAILASYRLLQTSSQWQLVAMAGFDGTDTTDLLLRSGASGAFELYDVSNSSVTGSVAMGQVGPEWAIAGFYNFSGNVGETDMLMRRIDGAFVLFDISNNQYTGYHTMGQVGPEWSIAAFGDFSANPNETDMLMRRTDGAFELFDISHNQYTGFHAMGQVGPEWSVVGFGDFSGNPNEDDMLMRRTDGAFELFDISNNRYTGYYSLGTVSSQWSIAGFGDFSGNPNETDMLMRNDATGAFSLYDIHNNQLSGPIATQQVGPEWGIAGFGDFSGNVSETDMLMRNSSTGAFELYDISNNQFTGSFSLGTVSPQLTVAAIGGDQASSAAAQIAQAISTFSPGGSATESGATPGAEPMLGQLNQPIVAPHLS